MDNYTTVNITYNEERNINDYLDNYGHDILKAYKSSGDSTEVALAKMRRWYGVAPINRWIVKHHIVTRTPIIINNPKVRRVPYYA